MKAPHGNQHQGRGEKEIPSSTAVKKHWIKKWKLVRSHFGKELYHLRITQRRQTQAQFAPCLGIEPRTLGRLENAKNPSPLIMQNILEFSRQTKTQLNEQGIA